MASSSSTHEDRRFRYLRGLFLRAKDATVANYREKEWQHLCKALARISLSDVPLPNRQAVRDSVKGCGDAVEELLKRLDDRSADNRPPAKGRYCGAAAALLVALLDISEGRKAAGSASKEPDVVSKEDLIDAAARICEQSFIPSHAYAQAASVKTKAPQCAAAQQLSSLCGNGMQLVKEMQRKKLSASGVAFCLTDLGRAKAQQLRRTGEVAAAAPLHHNHRAEAGEVGALMLMVDEREGGGAQHHLKALCDALRRNDARFETRLLKSGDYQFVWCDGGALGAAGGTCDERVVSHLIERKSAIDVAESIRDGRWERQQVRMRKQCLERFNGRATLEYIIEGDVANELHSCQACAHLPRDERGVGGCSRSGYPPLRLVEAALDALGGSGFKVTRTDSLFATAAHLAAEQQRLQSERPATMAAPLSRVSSPAASSVGSVDGPSGLSAATLAGQLDGRGSGGVYASKKPFPTPPRGSNKDDGAAVPSSHAIPMDSDEGDGPQPRAPPPPPADAPSSSAAAKRPRAKKAATASADAPPKMPRRQNAPKRPKKPNEFAQHPLPEIGSCNYAYLVVMDREGLLRQSCQEAEPRVA